MYGLSGIRLTSNQVTHILGRPTESQLRVDETLATAALCSPQRRRRRRSNYQNNNFVISSNDNNSSNNSSSSINNNHNNSRRRNNNNNGEEEQHMLPSWVSPTRQHRNPLIRAHRHENVDPSFILPAYGGVCIGTGPETLSPTRTSPVRHNHPSSNLDGTPWRRHHHGYHAAAEDEENNTGRLVEDSRVEIEQNQQQRNWLTSATRQTRQHRNDNRGHDNNQNDIVSTRRPFQFMRSLG